MPRVLLCHRGDESRDVAGRVGDRLRAAFGPRQVVQPVEIDPGTVCREAARCDAVVIVLGLRAEFADPNEPTRLALETALGRGVTVIPALIDGTGMVAEAALPESLRPLVYQNGLRLRPDPRFDRDVARLIEGVRRPASLAEPPSPQGWLVAALARSPGRMAVYTALLVGGVIAVAATANRALTPEGALGLMILLPAVLGLVAGGRHGCFGAVLGFLFGLLLPGLELFGFILLGVFLAGGANLCRGANFMTDATDHWIFVTVAAGCLALTGLLGAAGLAARRAAPAAPPGRIRRAALLGALLGLLLGAGLAEAAQQFGKHPGDDVAALGGLLGLFVPVCLLVGAELGFLDAALTDWRRRRP